MNDAGIFWVLCFSSAQINNVLLVWDFLGYAKNVGIFWIDKF